MIASVAFPTARQRRQPAWRVALGWTGASAGTVALVAAASVAGVFIGVLTEAGARPGPALAAVLVAIACGAGAMLVLYVAARVYAKVIFAALALVLFTAGCLMLVFAPVFRQVNSSEIAEYRAFNTLITFGALSTLAGLALAAQCLRWAMRRRARRQLARWARLLGSAYGVMLGLSGIFGIISLLSLTGADGTIEQDIVEQSISITAIAMWSLAPGLILTYHGISASMGEGSSELRLPAAGWGFLALAGVLAIGGLNMAAERPVAAPMPLLHVLAAALPGATYVAMAAHGVPLSRGRHVRGLTWRQLTLAAALSMTAGTVIALYFEALGGFAAVILLLVRAGAFTGATGSDIGEILRDSDYLLSDTEQFIANLVTAAMIAPLVEEFSKGLGVRFLLRGGVTTRAQAFLMGAAAGAGFGFLEALLYGLAGISDGGPGIWWEIMLVRGGSSSLHVFTTGLVGLAWWHLAARRDARLAAQLFLAAVGAHALWNGLAVTIDSRILGLDTLSERAIAIVAYVALAPIGTGFLLAIPFIASRIREPEPPPVAGTALAAMAPWLG